MEIFTHRLSKANRIFRACNVYILAFAAMLLLLSAGSSAPSVSNAKTASVAAPIPIRYVRTPETGGTPTGDGLTWATASSDLQAMIDDLADNGGGEVFVAAGTYRPTVIAGNGTSDRDKAFVLGEGVSIYGGFPASEEPTINDRDWHHYKTILSGDLNGDDIPGDLTSNRLDNTYHVVISAGNAEEGILDGLVITGGNGYPIPIEHDIIVNGSEVNRGTGGGIFVRDAYLTLSNLMVRGNISANAAGVLVYEATVTLANSVISGNSTMDVGTAGGITVVDSQFELTNVIVTGNTTTASGYGAGLFISGSDAAVTNVTISGNAGGTGTGLTVITTGLVIRNSIIWGNGESNVFSPSGFSGLSGNNLIEGEAGQNEIDGVPYTGQGCHLFAGYEPATPGNPVVGGDYTLLPSSPAINQGDNSFFPDDLAIAVDLAGNPRLFGAAIDLGAYEFQGEPTPTHPPEASDVTATGMLRVGQTLTGDYLFSDADNHCEGISTFRWLRADDAAGTNKTAIDDATELTYTLVAGDEGKYISFEVTPHDGLEYGTAVESALRGPVEGPPPAPSNWMAIPQAPGGAWTSIAYGDGRFVAVSYGFGAYVMTSDDGLVWSAQTAAQDNQWYGLTYGNGLFVAVASTGTHRIMTSPDGITWTSRMAVASQSWRSVAYGGGKFVAVGNGTSQVMVSENGTDWSGATGYTGSWNSVTYGNGMFVAVGHGPINRVMTSPDGITWTVQTDGVENAWWQSVAYGNGVFVAVASHESDKLVMTSPDGIHWTPRAVEGDSWRGVTFGDGHFVAVSAGEDVSVMTSPDGVNWEPQTVPQHSTWSGVGYGDGLFVAIARSTPHVMIAGDLPNRAPVIYAPSVASLTGSFEVGATLQATYMFQDPDGDSDQSRFQWYRYDEEYSDAGKTLIADATDVTYVVQDDDLGKWIAVEITPSDGEDDGFPALSQRRGPVIAGGGDHGGARRFVKTEADGGKPKASGDSWASASSDLQTMIDVLWKAGGGEIWVAAGTYSAPDLDAEKGGFIMRDDVAIYGGFSGVESTLEQRNWQENETILSGDKLKQVIHNDYYEMDPLGSGAILDGFTVADGTATGSGFGSGIFNRNASPVFRNLIIRDNLGAYQGGGVANLNSSPVFMNVLLTGNSANSTGGGMHSAGGSEPTLFNVRVQGNISNGGGGGLSLADLAHLTAVNMLVTGNVAMGGGGIVSQSGSGLTLSNVTVSGNYANPEGGGGLRIIGDAPVTLTNSVIWGNENTDYMGGALTAGSSHNLIAGLDGHNHINGVVFTGDATELFAEVAPATSGNPTTAGNYQLTACSPLINMGNNDGYLEGSDVLAKAVDLAGNRRLMFGTVDIGAFEYQDIPSPALLLPKQDSTYLTGQVLRFTVDFHQVVTVSGTPYLPITVGDAKRRVVYREGSGSEELLFTYVVMEGDEALEGITIDGALVLDGGSVSYADNTPAALQYCPVTVQGIFVDGRQPGGPEEPQEPGEPQPGAPEAPSGLRATAGDRQVTLFWNAPEASDSPITNYVIEYSMDGGATWTRWAFGPSTETTAVIDGLENGRAYAFRVAAVNEHGQSAFSTVLSGVVPTDDPIDPASDFPIRVHRAVSPNGDGINEFLRVEGIHEYPDNKVSLFSRNGTLIWEAKGYDNDRVAFRGVGVGGLNMPAGTYFYIVEINRDGHRQYRQGYFVLRY